MGTCPFPLALDAAGWSQGRHHGRSLEASPAIRANGSREVSSLLLLERSTSRAGSGIQRRPTHRHIRRPWASISTA
jgi:hypothetical protein